MTTTAVDDQFAPEPIQELEQKHHDKIVGIIAEKIEAERRPAPHGWKLVPAEPTPDWIANLSGKGLRIGKFESAIEDMLAAAPTPPAQASGRAAPSAETAATVNRETVIEWLDALDIEVTDKQLDGLFHAAPVAAQKADEVECGCGDIYPADSYGAGFIDALGHCPNCEAAEPFDDSQKAADARDAARWRYIRRKLCLTGNGDGTCAMQAINLPANISGWPEPGKVVEFCEEAIDAARQQAESADQVQALREALHAAAEYIGDRSAGSSMFWDLYDAAMEGEK